MLASSGASSRMRKYQAPTPTITRTTTVTPTGSRGSVVNVPSIRSFVRAAPPLRVRPHLYADDRPGGSRMRSDRDPQARLQPPVDGASRQRVAVQRRGPARRPPTGATWPRSSSHPDQVPTASPARKPAPSVVASRSGDTSTGRWVASATAWTNVGLAVMPPSTRSRSRASPVSASAASTRSAPRCATPSSTARTSWAGRCPG